MKLKKVKGKLVIELSTSDKDADWIKLVNPKATAADRKATEEALAKHNAEGGGKGEGQNPGNKA